MIYAYLRSSTVPYTLHIPLSNIQSSDIALRPELRPVLAKADLRPGDLITLSDLPKVYHGSSKHAESDNPAQFMLVDHNVPTGLVASLKGSAIVGCIDHHDDEGYIKASSHSAPRLIEKSGSCMSLVVSDSRKAWEELLHSEEDAKLAQLALAPILIDTNNLKSESKTKEVDRAATEFLESYLKDQDYDRDAYFNEITEAKQDIGSLSLDDIFRKDYKMWEENGMRLGTSSVVKNIDFLVQKAGSRQQLAESFKQFADEKKLNIFAVMTAFSTDGEFERELVVFANDEQGSRAAEVFVQSDAQDLGLRSWEDGGMDGLSGKYLKCWVQEQIEHSRKQVGPMLRKAMKGS